MDSVASASRRLRCVRTDVLVKLEKCINNRNGTDGHRTIGRPWHVSRLKNYVLVKVICSSTRNTLPLPHPERIRSPVPLTIRCWYLCLATLTPDLILAGRSRPRHGQPCSSVSSRETRSVTSHMITAYRMRQSGECYVLRVATKWTCEHGSPTWPGEHTVPA